MVDDNELDPNVAENADAVDGDDAPAPGPVYKTPAAVALNKSAPILVISFAFLLNVVGMAFTVHSLRVSHRSLASRFDELDADAAKDDGLDMIDDPSILRERGDTEALREIAAQLEKRGQHGAASRIRGMALKLDGIERQEWGHYKEALDEFRGGRTRLARRRFYQILARGDEPGTRWSHIADAARFDIGLTLVKEAEWFAVLGNDEGGNER